MAELKRNFLRGRMNKDLDERLVSNGEYRDASNIEVSTSEGSAVGTVQNIKGNLKTAVIGGWDQSGFTPRQTRASVSLTFANKENAFSVASYVDKSKDSIYNFIHKANDFIETESSAGVTRQEGIRCDVIQEFKPQIDEQGGGSSGIIVDVYEVRYAAQDTTDNSGIKRPMQDISGAITNDAITGLPTIATTSPQGTTILNAAGIRVGMRVQLISAQGVDLWGSNNEILVTEVPDVVFTGTGKVKITPIEGLQHYNSIQRDAGSVLKFTSSRILNFNGGEKLEETNTSNNTSTYTPTGRLITGINVIDNLLFFTDGANEPKKINITECKRGTISEYKHTTNTFPPNTGTYLIEEEHVTTIRPNPKRPPKVQELGASFGGNTQIVTVDASGSSTTHAATYSNVAVTTVYGLYYGVTGGLDFLEGNGNPYNLATAATVPQFYIYAQEERVHWKHGDEITLVGNTTGSVAKVIIIESHLTSYLVDTGSGPAPSSFQVFKVVLSFLSDEYSAGSPTELWTGSIAVDEKFYPEKFISIAYRYKYRDEEVSAISPYSRTTFLPGYFQYSAQEGQNNGMRNRSDGIQIFDFVPTDIPNDVKEVELLFRDHDFESVHHFKTIKRGEPEFTNAGTGANSGNLEIRSELFGEMLPHLQLDRLFDNVPRAAKAQEFSAGRLMYGNYLQNYDLPNYLMSSNLSIYELEPTTVQTVDLNQNFRATTNNGEFLTNSPHYDGAGLVQPGNVQSPRNEFYNNVQVALTSFNSNGEAEPNWEKWHSLTYCHFINSIPYDHINGGTNLERHVNKSWWEEGDHDLGPQAEIRDYIDIFNNVLNTLDQLNANYIVGGSVGAGSLLAAGAGVSFENLFSGVVNSSPWAPLPAELQKYARPRYWGHWKFKVNFSWETSDLNNNYNSIEKVQNGGTGEVENFGTAVGSGEIFLEPSVAGSTNTVEGLSGRSKSVYRLSAPGAYKVKAHGRYRCARGSHNGTGFNVGAYAHFDVMNGVFNVYRCTENGVPFGLPLAIGNGGNGINPDFTSSALPFGRQKVDTSSGDPKNYRGTQVEATIQVNATQDYNDHYSAVVGDHICICFEVDPGEIPHWSDSNFAASGILPALTSAEVTGLHSTSHIVTSIDVASSSMNDPMSEIVKNTPDQFGNTGNAVFEVTESPFVTEEMTFSKGNRSVKSNRSYQLGWVYGDRFGRESSVLIDESSTLFMPHSKCNNINGLEASLSHNPPPWAEYYKFFIRENTNRFYNIALHKAYDNNDPGTGDPLFAWLSFSSADRDKVSVGDKLLLKKKHASADPVLEMYKLDVLDISSGVPSAAGVDSSGTIIDTEIDTTVGGEIVGGDRTGKFFIKVRWSTRFEELLGTFAFLQGPSAGGAIFEVLPKSQVFQSEDSDEKFGFFYEASQAYPIKLKGDQAEQYIPVESIVSIHSSNFMGPTTISNFNSQKLVVNEVIGADSCGNAQTSGATLHNQGLCRIKLTPASAYFCGGGGNTGNYIRFTKSDGSYVTAKLAKNVAPGDDSMYLIPYTSYQVIGLNWFNCYSFLNGVESDGIEDRFNSPTLFPYTAIGKQSGFKGVLKGAETEEEWKYNDITFSQLYSEDRKINGTNQFLKHRPQGNVKKLAPAHGRIQKLFSRNNDLIALCEDKILKILSSGKDALFNADGNMQLLASTRVLGQAIPFSGDYGISRNPESFAADEFRAYFTDRDRGAVLRLSMDGMTPINLTGMKDWFGDNLRFADVAIGSFDGKKDEYNLTIHSITNPGWKKEMYTVSFSELIDGWVSFKSFMQESGLSLNNRYYTTKGGVLYQHHPEVTVNRNLFYSTDTVSASGTHAIQETSSVTPIINDQPDSVKSFKTLNYEGSQSRIVKAFADIDGDGTPSAPDEEYFGDTYYNLTATNGWYVEDIHTDLQEGQVNEFIKKEGKYFNHIHGVASTFTNAADNNGTAVGNIDFKEFTSQGIGIIASQSISGSTSQGFNVTVYLGSNTATSFSSNVYTAQPVTLNNVTTATGTSQITISPTPGNQIQASSFPTVVGGSSTLYSTVTFANTGTPNSPSNQVVATINWNGGSVSANSTIFLNNASTIATNTVFVSFLITIGQFANYGTLPSISTSNVLSGIYVTPVNVTFTDAITNNPFEVLVGYQVSGLMPQDETNDILTMSFAPSSGSSYISSLNPNYDLIQSDTDTGFDLINSILDLSSSNISDDDNDPGGSITFTCNPGSDNVYSTDNVNLAVEFTEENITCDIIQNSYTFPSEGDAVGLGFEVNTIGCYVGSVSDWQTSPTASANASWITASVGAGGNTINIICSGNSTGADRVGVVGVFSNLNLGNDPDDTIVINQTAQEAIYLTAAFQTQNGTATYTESGESGAEYGAEYPTYVIGSNTEIPLPNIPAAGVEDLKIMINSNMTADQPIFDQSDQGAFLVVNGVPSDNPAQLATFNINWITFADNNALNLFEEGIGVGYYTVHCNIAPNNDINSRSVTLKAMHPNDSTAFDILVITQEGAYDSTTDTAEFYYNSSQDYTGWLDGVTQPTNGTVLTT